jgi:hypothetical protein
MSPAFPTFTLPRKQDEQGGNPDDKGRRSPTLLRRGRLRWCRWLRLGGDADSERIDPDRVGNVLESLLAEIGDSQIEPPLDLTVSVLGKTDTARLGDALPIARRC